MSPNHSSKSSMSSGDSPLERTISGGSSLQRSNSSRSASAFGRVFGHRPVNRLRKGSVDLRDAEASLVRPSEITATAAGSDTPRPSTATDSTADSVPADFQANATASIMAIHQAASKSEGSRDQSQSQPQSQFKAQSEAQTQAQSQSQFQSQAQSSTTAPARYGSQRYTEEDIATLGANSRPGIRSSDAAKAIAAFASQQSKYGQGRPRQE